MRTKRRQLHRLSTGELPRVTWPGCYPLAYLCQDGGTLCPDCANGKNGSQASEKSDDPQWKIIDQFVVWETEVTCDHCNKIIKPAYK